MPESDGPRRLPLDFIASVRAFASRWRIRIVLALSALAVLAIVAYVAKRQLNSRPVLRIGMVESQVSQYMKFTLGNWRQEEHGNVLLEAVPLPYDDLFRAENQAGPPLFDVVMIDDPWLAQLAEEHRLDEVPQAEFADKLRRFSPEFLRVSWYRHALSHRPAVEQLVGQDRTHPISAMLTSISTSYGLYSLPYAGNFQALVRHSPNAAEDSFGQALAGGNADWKKIEAELNIAEKGKVAHFYSRLGSNNSALADFLPILWAEGGCLIRRNGDRQESGLRTRPKINPGGASEVWVATNALKLSLNLAIGHIQYSRFQDEDVQKYLLADGNSMGVSWMAFRSYKPASGKAGSGENLGWYWMPRVSAGVDPADTCDTDDERSNQADAHGVSSIGVWSLGVDARSTQKHIAWEFIEWQLNELLKARPTPPARSCDTLGKIGSAPTDQLGGYPTPFEDQLTCAERTAIRNARTRPSLPQWRDVEEAVGFRIRQAHWRTLPAGDAIEQADKDLNWILKRSTGSHN